MAESRSGGWCNMRKERLLKEDGRYIIFYSFEEDEEEDEDA